MAQANVLGQPQAVGVDEKGKKLYTIPLDIVFGPAAFENPSIIIGPFTFSGALLRVNALQNLGTADFGLIRSISFALTAEIDAPYQPGAVFFADLTTGWTFKMLPNDYATGNTVGFNVSGSMPVISNGQNLVIAQSVSIDPANPTHQNGNNLFGRINFNNFDVEPIIYSSWNAAGF